MQMSPRRRFADPWCRYYGLPSLLLPLFFFRHESIVIGVGNESGGKRRKKEERKRRRKRKAPLLKGLASLDSIPSIMKAEGRVRMHEKKERKKDFGECENGEGKMRKAFDMQMTDLWTYFTRQLNLRRRFWPGNLLVISRLDTRARTLICGR